MTIGTDLLVSEEAPLNLSKSLSLASKTDPGNLDSPLKPVLKLFCVFALILFLEPMLVTESDCAGDRSTESYNEDIVLMPPN